MSGAEVITLGCRLNLAESEAIRAGLGGRDDLIVINSCAVTAEAMAGSRRAIRRAARSRPDARIVVTGCASEIDREGFAAMAEVSAVVANAAKLDLSRYFSPPCKEEGGGGSGAPAMVPHKSSGARLRLAPTPGPSLQAGREAHARHFLPVQNGCDHRCTFCIIPYGRGPSRSLAAGDVIAAARAAVERGQREIVLTGVDLTAYGADLPGAPTLGLLVERILRFVPALKRLRLSSLDPCEIDDRLFDLITREPRVMPHLHLSLQAGDDMILKRMKRRHSRAQAVALVARLKAARPGIAIGADLIAGFPTESEAMFANTLALLHDCDIVLPHIFPYSPRAGTPAARMPQLEREVIRARAAQLREAGGRRQEAWLEAHIGTVQQVLVELDGATGHAEDFARVRLQRSVIPAKAGISGGGGRPRPQRDPGFRRDDERGDDVAGQILPLRITARDGDTLIGEPA